MTHTPVFLWPRCIFSKAMCMGFLVEIDAGDKTQFGPCHIGIVMLYNNA